MIDNQQIAWMLPEKLILQLLIISYLSEFGELLKIKLADNEGVSQRSGCSGWKNGTLKWNPAEIKSNGLLPPAGSRSTLKPKQM